jgi:hypothetical protein
MTTVEKMRQAAEAIGIHREFTPDGRFVGDLGEVIAEQYFGVKLNPISKSGQDGVCRISGKFVEVKLRSKSTGVVWLSARPDILLVLYLCPETSRWGVVCNGPSKDLLDDEDWNQSKNRFEPSLSALLDRYAVRLSRRESLTQNEAPRGRENVAAVLPASE